jgi:Ca2+-binding EF-hand superfamily protein
LFKAFKFFDLNNNGCLRKNDFFKAIAKCGVAIEAAVILKYYLEYGYHLLTLFERQ